VRPTPVVLPHRTPPPPPKGADPGVWGGGCEGFHEHQTAGRALFKLRLDPNLPLDPEALASPTDGPTDPHPFHRAGIWPISW
jgi:hypothetical protein